MIKCSNKKEMGNEEKLKKKNCRVQKKKSKQIKLGKKI